MLLADANMSQKRMIILKTTRFSRHCMKNYLFEIAFIFHGITTYHTSICDVGDFKFEYTSRKLSWIMETDLNYFMPDAGVI